MDQERASERYRPALLMACDVRLDSAAGANLMLLLRKQRGINVEELMS